VRSERAALEVLVRSGLTGVVEVCGYAHSEDVARQRVVVLGRTRVTGPTSRSCR
jgi:hypothetical protein